MKAWIVAVMMVGAGFSIGCKRSPTGSGASNGASSSYQTNADIQRVTDRINSAPPWNEASAELATRALDALKGQKMTLTLKVGTAKPKRWEGGSRVDYVVQSAPVSTSHSGQELLANITFTFDYAGNTSTDPKYDYSATLRELAKIRDGDVVTITGMVDHGYFSPDLPGYGLVLEQCELGK